ncbi:Bacterial protein of uncharacterised function (DUF945) [Rodentibacter pneumotropicus]|uniref:Bacterial protein of uncharacterized function (DUF945) n=1 Tax=Rodentibacter pneumotropicus TaxID=758 RepID=A0A3S4U1F2_9PAST|nr:Bacterial protein of uncharacterised function (DUF945) [Rodentibacter pneumotropicus]
MIAILGAAWVGGVWFTGQTAETEYKRQIELANQRFRTLGDSDSFNIEFKISNLSVVFSALKWKMKL